MLNPETRPDDGSHVRKFAVWWMRHKPFKVPADGVRVFTGVSGLTLYRDGPFQVQMFIVAPNAGSPEHAHPNIDSVEYGLAGADTFKSTNNTRFKGLICVAPSEFHTAAADARGGAFLSIQKWINGIEPSSVELDWIGASIDQKHAAMLTTAEWKTTLRGSNVTKQ